MLKLFTTHCGQCRIIEERLKQKRIPYEIEEDMQMIIAVSESTGITQLPIVGYQDKYYSGSALDALIKTL